MTDPDLQPVRLVGLPLELHRWSSQHHAALDREFALLAAAEPDDRSVPVRLLALVDELRGRFSGFTVDANAALAAAEESAATTIDLDYHLPPDAGQAAQRLDDLFDEADSFCRAGSHLLTLAAPEPVARYRRWFLHEFVRQLAGEPPRAWAEVEASAVVDEERVVPTEGGPDPIRFRLPAELDLDQAPHVRSVLMGQVGRGHIQLEVDGSQVEFIDSVGVSVLMAVHARCEAAGGTLRIDPASDRVRSVLKSVGVDDVLL
ncbi:MAG: STAS domain-containing protein [Acidimicrobiia bacterium]|nr:STAS domain-containing protein [Acidimicrobiia bacterium]